MKGIGITPDLLQQVCTYYAQKGNIYHTLAWTTAYSDDRLN